MKTKKDDSDDKSLEVLELTIKIAEEESNEESKEEVSIENILTSTKILSNCKLLSNPNI